MSKFRVIDLSTLEAPTALVDAEPETVIVEAKAELKRILPAFNVDLLSEPAIKQIHAFATREGRVRALINSAVRAGYLSSAEGGDLDLLGEFYRTPRLVVSAPGVTPAAMEGDEEYRERIHLAPDAWSSAGTATSYAYHARAASGLVRKVDVWSPRPREAVVAVQAREGDGYASQELLSIVRAYLSKPEIKPLTDVVKVQSVENVYYTIDVEIFVLPGPDTSVVEASARASLEAMAADRRTPDREAPMSAIYAAAQVGPADKVVLRSPLADIATASGQVPVCEEIKIKVTRYAG